MGDEVNYLIYGLEDLCRIKPGPTPALEPLLLRIFRKPKSDEIQGRIGLVLVKLDKKHQDEVVRTLAERIGTDPSVSRGALMALVQIKPDHPKALAKLKEFLQSSQAFDRQLGLSVVNGCSQPIPGVREIIAGWLPDETDIATKFLAYTAIMRLDNKLNDKWIDEMLEYTVNPGPAFMSLDAIRQLGPLGKPLIPRLLAFGTGDALAYHIERIIEFLGSE